MHNLVDIINPIKPKYQDNRMPVFFNKDRLVFSPSKDITIIKTGIGLDDVSPSLIMYSDVGDIGKALTDISDDLLCCFMFDLPDRFFTVNISSQILDVFNAISSCGEESCSGTIIRMSDRSFEIFGHGIDFVLQYINSEYFMHGMNMLITSRYDLSYYIYTLGKLFADKKNGLSIRIFQDNKYTWLNCEGVFIRIECSEPIVSLVHLEDLFKNCKELIFSSSNRKLLNDIYGTRFKHLSKCMGEIVNYSKKDKYTLFSSSNINLALTGVIK